MRSLAVTTTLQNNTFEQAGVTITEPNANAPIEILQNQFSSATLPDDALLLVKHDYNSTSPVTVQGNMFTVPSVTFMSNVYGGIGVLSADSVGVNVEGNIFTPAPGASDTTDVMVDTFVPTGTQRAPYRLSQFNQHHRQLVHWHRCGGHCHSACRSRRHPARPRPVPNFGAVTIGGPGAERTASPAGSEYYITLATASAGVSYSSDAYATPNAGNVGINIDASQNIYAGTAAASLTLSEAYAVEDKITDYLDNPSLGYVSLNSMSVYVAQTSELAADGGTAGAIQRGITWRRPAAT